MTPSLQEQLQLALQGLYVIERELGGGGMSRVFLAHETALGRKVVVKVLLPELAAGVNVERFRREIQLAAQLQHPHIVPLLSAGEADGLPYFVMPFVTGESLRSRVAREGELPIAETVRILRDVVSALAYAHARGVVHRDVKPDNVLLSGGVAVVTDFGVAKAVSASSGEPGDSLTSHGVALGTPAYMAPEQATANPQTDHRADIYSLGLVAYELLTGGQPFAGRTPQAVLAAQVVEDPEPVERRRPAVPPMLANLVRDCLAKRPAERPQSALHVMNVLDAIATPSGGTEATTAVRLPVAAAESRRRSWPLLAAVGTAAAVIIGIAFWLQPPASSPPTESRTSATDSGAITLDSVRPPPPAPPPPAAGPSAAEKPAPVTPPPRPTETRRARPAPRKPAISQTPVPPATSPRESLLSQPADTASAADTSPPVPAAIGAAPVAPAAAPRESTPQAPPAAPPAPAPLPSPPTAPAPRSTDPRPEIRTLVARYASAIEAENLGELKRVYPGMTGLQERGWEQFFQLVRDVKADLSLARLDTANRGAGADAQITGSYTYLNTSTGRTEHQPVSFQASFKQDGGQWRMSQVH